MAAWSQPRAPAALPTQSDSSETAETASPARATVDDNHNITFIPESKPTGRGGRDGGGERANKGQSAPWKEGHDQSRYTEGPVGNKDSVSTGGFGEVTENNRKTHKVTGGKGSVEQREHMRHNALLHFGTKETKNGTMKV